VGALRQGPCDSENSDYRKPRNNLTFSIWLAEWEPVKGSVHREQAFQLGATMNGEKEQRWMELCEQAPRDLRRLICSVSSLLRIHSPYCEHCMARLTCGDELRRRLEELNWKEPCSHSKEDSQGLPRAE
jgi:hypothetical protein